MNILIAPDKFKGTLTAWEVCAAVSAGLRDSGNDVAIREIPLADGGDGTLDFFLSRGGKLVRAEVHDPLMRPVSSSFAISSDGSTAYVEMALASGLMLLKPEERNPLLTTTYGTGELIQKAIEQGASHIILGIGGSATTDGGIGMMAALGVRFMDEHGNDLPPWGGSLVRIRHVDESGRLPQLNRVRFTALCDVKIPFYGDSGTAFVYSPQKGATAAMVAMLDSGLRQLAAIIQQDKGIDVQRIPGSGAGGGIAAGALVWLGATLQPGIEVIFELAHFADAVTWADVIVTGEGKIDRQTWSGKVVAGVVEQARKQGKRIIVVCGQSDLGASPGVTLFSLTASVGLERALHETSHALREMVAREVAKQIIKG